MPQVVSVKVVNCGRKPVIVHGHGFLLKDKNVSIFPDILSEFNGKRLAPYEFLDITLPNAILRELVKKSDQISSFFICDTLGKKWYPRKKEINDFVFSLKNKRSN